MIHRDYAFVPETNDWGHNKQLEIVLAKIKMCQERITLLMSPVEKNRFEVLGADASQGFISLLKASASPGTSFQKARRRRRIWVIPSRSVQFFMIF